MKNTCKIIKLSSFWSIHHLKHSSTLKTWTQWYKNIIVIKIQVLKTCETHSTMFKYKKLAKRYSTYFVRSRVNIASFTKEEQHISSRPVHITLLGSLFVISCQRQIQPKHNKKKIRNISIEESSLKSSINAYLKILKKRVVGTKWERLRYKKEDSRCR